MSVIDQVKIKIYKKKNFGKTKQQTESIKQSSTDEIRLDVMYYIT